MLILVCGGRNYSDKEFLFRSLDHCKKWWNPDCLIHGGAKGADTLAGQWADSRNIDKIIIPADWTAHGRAAGMIRNKKMLTFKPSVTIAFNGGAGTENMITLSRQAGIPVLIL